MKKKIPTIHITGLNILMQLLMHKKFHKHKFIYYETYFNNNEDLNYNLSKRKLRYEKKVLLAIKTKFSLNLVIIENKLFATFFYNGLKTITDHKVYSKIFIKDGDIISNNLYNFFYRYMIGKNIIFLSEGIGIYGLGKKKNFINKIIKFLKLKFKFYKRNCKLSFYPEKIILFKDENKWTKEYLNNYILPYDKIDLLSNKSNQKYIRTYSNIFLKLSKKFSYYFNQNYQCFYPIIGKLSYEENKKRIMKILKKYNGNVLVKCHGADTRDFSKIKKISKRIILMEGDSRWFPGELFLKKKTLFFCYLTILIFFMKKK